jgi:hypothetical protein
MVTKMEVEQKQIMREEWTSSQRRPFLEGCGARG